MDRLFSSAMRSTSLIALVLAIGMGCTNNPPPDVVDGGGGDDGGSGDTGGPSGPDAGVDAHFNYVPHDAGYDDAGPAAAFTAPMETWTGITIEGSHCGNGSPMVVAVNLTNQSTDVVVYFQGGGACWDGGTCFGLHTATHIEDTLTAASVVAEAMTASETPFVLHRDDTGNPYRTASYVYIPYCTGDGHSGTTVTTLSYNGTDHQVHFEGARNSELVLERTLATVPTTTHVTLVGASGGGYGVLGNWWRAQAIFASARVDALSDSGLPLDVPAARWTVMQNAWGIDLPPGCDGCDSLGDALPFYARTMPLPHRFGLLAYIDDTVISMFYAESSVHAGLVALEAPMNATTNQRYFYVNDHGHVVLGDDSQEAGTSGVSARQWVTQFATDDAAWASVGP